MTVVQMYCTFLLRKVHIQRPIKILCWIIEIKIAINHKVFLSLFFLIQSYWQTYLDKQLVKTKNG